MGSDTFESFLSNLYFIFIYEGEIQSQSNEYSSLTFDRYIFFSLSFQQYNKFKNLIFHTADLFLFHYIYLQMEIQYPTGLFKRHFSETT